MKQIYPFEKHLDHSDMEKRERTSNWLIAIGLQAVDGLRLEIARRQIEGEITMDEVQKLILAYQQSKMEQTR